MNPADRNTSNLCPASSYEAFIGSQRDLWHAKSEQGTSASNNTCW